MKKYALILIVLLLLLSKQAAAEFGRDTGVCMINAVTGETVFEKNAYRECPMASTTKIMTALVALENSNPYDVVTMSEEAVGTEGSSTYAKAGDMLYMEDVLYGLMLNSGNDAARAVAYTVAGSEKEFARLMTERAAECGALKTSFANPSGLPDDEHYTTAYDMAMIAREAMKNEKFAEIVFTRKHTARPLNDAKRQLVFYNHNKLLSLSEDCIGIKTGYTKNAGRCLVSAAERGGMQYIAVTLNDDDDWNNHIKMYNDAFAASEPITVTEKGECIRTDGQHRFIAAESFVVPSLRGTRDSFEAEVNIPEICAPVNAGEKVGYLRIMHNEKEIGRVDIISESDMTEYEGMRKKYSSCLIKCIKKLFLR